MGESQAASEPFQFVVAGDGVVDDWTLSADESVSVDPASTARSHSGETSLAINFAGAGTYAGFNRRGAFPTPGGNSAAASSCFGRFLTTGRRRCTRVIFRPTSPPPQIRPERTWFVGVVAREAGRPGQVRAL